jgi:hypothetical protein
MSVGVGFGTSGVGDGVAVGSVFAALSGLSGAFGGTLGAGFGLVPSFPAASAAIDSVISDL